ncbi:helicase-exonuclease AddAB subunit AddA [Clostridium fungisolvens]|uniref:ATP-dependent helicase/nuclease subunit A n=1 Tax=Clostridium fungisolvens TaxID=1604897 RepID=A0A6V8SM29_9CLOT|nr:helicase-exonuclease AddAB subunit AddA [Clostridium fungisolvens]GFP78289.1 ATP-dependent helicase/nuclease subunit A [Clostridium fungisolvens]
MGETKWTAEQLSAITTRRRNLLVAAAAGSGKTAVLVERIIRMITEGEEPVDIDSLLVVTFTSAAAAEMRERIGDAISKALEHSPNSKVLQRQLALLNRANITTMHSFCLDVIKNNFHHIDLDPNFRIGDDTECTLIRSEVVSELFEDRYDQDDDSFKKLVDSYGQGKDDSKLQQMVLDLYQFSMSEPWPETWLKEKCEELNICSEEELNNSHWAKILINNVEIELETFERLLHNAKELSETTEGLEPYLTNIEDDINQIISIREGIAGGLSSVYNKIEGLSFSKLKSVKKNQVSDEEAQQRVKDIRDDVKKKLNKMKEDIFSIPPEEAVKDFKILYFLINELVGLVLEFDKRYKGKKRDRGILDFNDLEHLCLNVLTEEGEDGQIMPSSVAKEFKMKFSEVLVDEYQDTNNIQETIISMVSRKEEEDPNVFMVGDVKQSIYRFRHAKPELFLNKYNSYPTDGSHDMKIMLYKNFRSRKEVIDGVNYIFNMLMSKSVGELEYDENEALNLGADYKDLDAENVYDIENEVNTQDIEIAGDIEVHILDKSAQKEDSEEAEVVESDMQEDVQNSEAEEDLDSIQIEARIVAKRIHELMNASNGKKYMVWDRSLDKYRRLKYKDIVILLRATKNWSEVFVDELGQSGIPVYADTGTGYFDTIEIRTIMSLLQVIDNPMQDIHILSVLRSPIFLFSSEELGELRLIDKEKYFYEILKSISEGALSSEASDITINDELKRKCVYFAEKLKLWRDKALYMPIDEFIWYLYMDTSYYGYAGAMPNGVQRQANLRILFQRAKQYEKTSFKGLFNFINFINKLRKSSGDMGSAKILGENEDVVRIMSIHKSKGLEFPVVFLSGCGKQFNLMDLNKEILFHDELGFGPEYIDVDRRISYTSLPKHAIKMRFKLEALSEEMRVLYVAFTRAKEKLIITGAVSNLEKVTKRWCSAAALSDDKILSSEVLKGKSYMDWIGMALAKHKNGEELRKSGNTIVDYIKSDFSTWNIKYWSKNDVIVDEKLKAVDEIEDESQERRLFIYKDSGEINEDIERRLDFQYKFKSSTSIAANISVSDLKRAAYEEDQNEIETIYKGDRIIKPQFLQEEKGLSAAERGTVVHFVMQHIELGKLRSREEVEDQLEDMVQGEFLTKEQAKVVNISKIFKFFQSNIGKRIIEAYENGSMLYRELPFFTEIPAYLVDKSLSKEETKDELVRLQGVVDCFFEEEDGLVLVDYKTDYVEEGNEQLIKDRYEVQLNYYSDTLEKITGKKVKEKYLYLFGLDKEVKY